MEARGSGNYGTPCRMVHFIVKLSNELCVTNITDQMLRKPSDLVSSRGDLLLLS